MSSKPLAPVFAVASAAVLAAGLALPAAADGMVGVSPEESAQAAQGAPGAEAVQAPSLSAKLVEPGAPGTAKDSARVQVRVSGVRSPLLQYRVDDGPAFETNDTSVRFRGLKPGPHKISVLLEGKDGAPLGPSETLDVDVP